MQASRGVKALGPFSCKAAMLPFPAGGRLLCPLRFSVSRFSRVRLRRSPCAPACLVGLDPGFGPLAPRLDTRPAHRLEPTYSTQHAQLQPPPSHRRPPPAAWALSNFGFAPHDQKNRSHSQLPAALHSLATVQAPKGPFPLDGPQPTYAPPPLHHQLPTQTLQRLYHRPWLKSA